MIRITFATCPSCIPLFRQLFSTLACKPFFKFASLAANSTVGASTLERSSLLNDRWYDACWAVSDRTF
jgi:hypothetical protein